MGEGARHQEVVDPACEELEGAGEGVYRKRCCAAGAAGAISNQTATQKKDNAPPNEVSGSAERLANPGDGLDFGWIREHLLGQEVVPLAGTPSSGIAGCQGGAGPAIVNRGDEVRLARVLRDTRLGCLIEEEVNLYSAITCGKSGPASPT